MSSSTKARLPTRMGPFRWEVKRVVPIRRGKPPLRKCIFPWMHKWDPEDYAKHSSAQLAWARELIARLKLRGDESVLDIGCGDGKVTAELAAALPRGHVAGLDGSQEMI